MAIVIENKEQLRSEIMRIIQVGMNLLAKEMTDDLGKRIQKQFYDAYTPTRYQRTYQLLKSAQREVVNVTPHTVEIRVFIDFNSMRHYRYNGTYIGTPTFRGFSFTEEELAESAAQGYHGIKSGYVAAITSGHFWESFEKYWNIKRVESRLAYGLRLLGMNVTVQ